MPVNPESIEEIHLRTIDNIHSTEIRNSNIHGFGLYATADIPAGTLLCYLEGQRISQKFHKQIFKSLEPEIESLESYLFMECNYLADDHVLVRPLRTKYSYINHGSIPNVSIKNDPFRLLSTTDIIAGDELTIDYRNEPLSEEYLSRPDKQFLKE